MNRNSVIALLVLVGLATILNAAPVDEKINNDSVSEQLESVHDHRHLHAKDCPHANVPCTCCSSGAAGNQCDCEKCKGCAANKLSKMCQDCKKCPTCTGGMPCTCDASGKNCKACSGSGCDRCSADASGKLCSCEGCKDCPQTHPNCSMCAGKCGSKECKSCPACSGGRHSHAH